MKSQQLVFLRHLLADAGRVCNIDTSQDYKYVLARFEKEGMAFLTISLPQFGKDLERSLELSRVPNYLFTGFAREKDSYLPKFLGGLMGGIFESSSGELLSTSYPEVVADDVNRQMALRIRMVRQICLAFGKLKQMCEQSRISSAFMKYAECETEIRMNERILLRDASLQRAYVRMANILLGDFLSEMDRKILCSEITPQHGPGATAERLVGNHKYEQREWPLRMEELFPYGEFVRPTWVSPEAIQSELVPDFVEPGAERPVRVIAVPKTQKTPRIIAIEPTCMQYMQQGLMEAIYDYWNEDKEFLYPFISTESQVPNQVYARDGSKSRLTATLDLSEASDRVSYQHVKLLLERHSAVMQYVDACRSSKADVPGIGVLTLSKFASMGSALTFPFESMIFLVVVFLGIESQLNSHLTREAIKSYVGKVRVYGDDIIVPVEFVASVIEALETFGYRVNSDKSFWESYFRESCGKEYWYGRDVSVVKVRTAFPTSLDQTEEIVSTVSLRNQLFLAGYEEAVAWLDEMILALMPFPFVEYTSPILGRLSHSGYTVDGTNSDTQTPFVKGMRVVEKARRSKIDGEAALMKFFLRRRPDVINIWNLPVIDKNHLLFGGRPVSVALKHGKALP